MEKNLLERPRLQMEHLTNAPLRGIDIIRVIRLRLRHGARCIMHAALQLAHMCWPQWKAVVPVAV